MRLTKWLQLSWKIILSAKIMRWSFLLGASLMMAVPVQAQDVYTDELAPAVLSDPGVLVPGQGGLDRSLWSRTSAAQAVDLLDSLPDQFSNPVARDLVRAVVLSGGTPPQGESDPTFGATRMEAIFNLADMTAAQEIIRRSDLSQDQQLQADMALLAGNDDGACSQSDSIVDGRGEDYWMRLRAYCHILRDEKPAAELTADLLKQKGYQDPAFYSLIGLLSGVPAQPNMKGLTADPLHIAMVDKGNLPWPSSDIPAVVGARMALNSVSTPKDKLKGVLAAGDALSDAQMQQVLSELSQTYESINLAGGGQLQPLEFQPVDYEAARNAAAPAAMGLLYDVARQGGSEDRTKAVAELLKRADRAGAFDRFAKLLTPQLESLSSYGGDLPLITRAAVARGDLSALQQVYQSLGDNPNAQQRVALAADALGNGFYGGTLGTDIDTRLAQQGSAGDRALRDALLAYALGANLSEAAMDKLEGKRLGSLSGDWLALQGAGKQQAQAQTALRAALLLEKSKGRTLDKMELYYIVDALYQAGLTEFAGRLAADDFLRGL